MYVKTFVLNVYLDPNVCLIRHRSRFLDRAVQVKKHHESPINCIVYRHLNYRSNTKAQLCLLCHSTDRLHTIVSRLP